MASSGKYVPPHLRNRTATPAPAGPLPSGGGGSGRGDQGFSRGGYGERSSADDRGHGGNSREAWGDRPAPQTNSRWSNFSSGGSRDGHRDRGSDRRYGGGRGGFGGATANAQGFHGSMRPDSRFEREVFTSSGTGGIDFDSYDDIPVDVSGENVPDPIEDFEVGPLASIPSLLANLKRANYRKPTPVQKHSCPIGVDGRDLMACAQTGSGKTAGFLFPLLAVMLTNGALPVPESGRRRKAYPNALVLAPTRELAQQIHNEAQKFSYLTGSF